MGLGKVVTCISGHNNSAPHHVLGCERCKKLLVAKCVKQKTTEREKGNIGQVTKDLCAAKALYFENHRVLTGFNRE